MIDINCDMGESFGIWKLADDEAIMEYCTTVNIACGFHASDPVTMRETVALARDQGVKAGAHPGLPDLWGFGRRTMAMDASDVDGLITYQVGALRGFLDAVDLPLHHVKPHGSLYGMTSRDPDLARAAAEVAARNDTALMGLADTHHEEAADQAGVAFIAEVFADLDYDDDGSLIISRTHGPLDLQVVARRVRQFVQDQTVTTVGGAELPVSFDTICFHSDTPGATDLAKTVWTTAQEAAA